MFLPVIVFVFICVVSVKLLFSCLLHFFVEDSNDSAVANCVVIGEIDIGD